MHPCEGKRMHAWKIEKPHEMHGTFKTNACMHSKRMHVDTWNAWHISNECICLRMQTNRHSHVWHIHLSWMCLFVLWLCMCVCICLMITFMLRERERMCLFVLSLCLLSVCVCVVCVRSCQVYVLRGEGGSSLVGSWSTVMSSDCSASSTSMQLFSFPTDSRQHHVWYIN